MTSEVIDEANSDISQNLFVHSSEILEIKGRYQTQIPTLPRFFFNLPAFIKNEVWSWNFGNLNKNLCDTNFFELKHKNFYKSALKSRHIGENLLKPMSIKLYQILIILRVPKISMLFKGYYIDHRLFE